MKKILLLLLGMIMLSSCLRTHTQTEEELREKRIRDSIHADSVNRRRNTPDTTLATFKRTVFCDKKQQVTFDRVKVLSGDEAAEYALRHKRFGNNVNVVVNQEVTLETLPMDSLATVLLLSRNDTDSLGKPRLVKSHIQDVEDIPKESVIQIVVLHRSIVYLRELEYQE